MTSLAEPGPVPLSRVKRRALWELVEREFSYLNTQTDLLVSHLASLVRYRQSQVYREARA